MTTTNAMPAAAPCHCHVLRRAARVVTTHYDAALAPAGLTTPRYALLRGLERLGPVSISAAAKSLSLDRTTLGRNLHPLEAAGFVARDVDAHDARERCLRLTARGADALRRAAPLWRTTQAGLEARFGAEKLAALHGLLADIEGALPRQETTP